MTLTLGDRDILQTQIGENIIVGQDDWKSIPYERMTDVQQYRGFYQFKNGQLSIRGFACTNTPGTTGKKTFNLFKFPRELLKTDWVNPMINYRLGFADTAARVSEDFLISDGMFKVNVDAENNYAYSTLLVFDVAFTQQEKES